MTDLRFLLEDQEDKGKSNNLRIREVPEWVGTENLLETLQGLFRLMFSPMDGVV